MSGRVVLVGAGPGDPELLTVRAVRELEAAEVLLYDALIEPAILELAPVDCERIDVGKRGDGARGVAQEEIAQLMVRKAHEGKRVVRLKGGDPFVFGRGGEEAGVLRDAGILFEVVPGVTSALAVPAYAGIPVTDRRLASSVAVITGHRGKAVEDMHVDWEGLAASAETLVILMGTRWIENIVERVIASGRDPETPAACIASGTTPRQRVVTAPLAELPARIRQAELVAPTVIVVGEVVRFREALDWFERRPLFGRRVLVGRALGQQDELMRELRRRGAEPVGVPLLAFEGPPDPGPLERALAALHSYDWLVFTSANALRFSRPHLDPGALGEVRVACVGTATARSAREAGLRVDVVPKEHFLPADLVAEMASRAPLAGARVLFPHGDRAHASLARLLESEGARVDPVVAYRTRIPPDAGARLRQALRDGLDALTLTSPSSVDHLFALLGDAELRERARKLIIACIGPTTAARLREHDLEPDLVSEPQTASALAEGLERWFDEHRDELS